MSYCCIIAGSAILFSCHPYIGTHYHLSLIKVLDVVDMKTEYFHASPYFLLMTTCTMVTK